MWKQFDKECSMQVMKDYLPPLEMFNKDLEVMREEFPIAFEKSIDSEQGSSCMCYLPVK